MNTKLKSTSFTRAGRFAMCALMLLIGCDDSGANTESEYEQTLQAADSEQRPGADSEADLEAPEAGESTGASRSAHEAVLADVVPANAVTIAAPTYLSVYEALAARTGTERHQKQAGELACYDTPVYLQSLFNRTFVSTEIGFGGKRNGMLRARASKVGPWEKYVLCVVNDAEFALISQANSRWVTAELSYTGGLTGMLRARATVLGPWELFLFSTDGASFFSTANGNYVTGEFAYTSGDKFMLRARAARRGPWEGFAMGWVQ